MKRFVLFAVAIWLSAQIFAQMNNVLNERQQSLVAIACHEAKGDMAGLEGSVRAGLDAGLTVNEVKEALSQLYAYTGFPRSLNALSVLQRVADERRAAGLPAPEGRDASPLPAGYDALRQGTDVQTRLVGQPFTYQFAPATDYYLKAHLFGDIFARDVLTYEERELVTVGALSGLPGVEPQLMAHVSGAANMGLSREQIHSIPLTLARRVGEQEAYRCRMAVAKFYKEKVSPAEPVDFSVYPKGEPNTAYARYFIGQSYLAPMGANLVNVTFEPRCRNNWHIHHGAVQVLVCVAGRGWYQEWGKEAVEMRPGTVIPIPVGVKHWHGAAQDSWFQHLTYMTDVQPDASTEWLEPVGDDTYLLLP